ncbi:hypothetical protein [Yinghuangia sp. YIM S09857]|uniref:hypothetical protein n=1 Tax=Yinghuangia sp. YIM S09857 TaxID=3436929 RepID=UPI003F53E14E
MPTPDDHLQDPQLARALRNLDLPGPVTPSLTAQEVRRRGARRRTRRHAAWAGSGLVAAAIAGALVVGPLTPDRSGRGPTSAAVSSGPAAPPVTTAPPGSPGTSEPTGEGTEEPRRSPVATLDLGARRLNMRGDDGAEDGRWFDVYISGAAFDQLAKNPLTLQITGRHRTLDMDGYGAELGKDTAVAVPWVITATAPDGTELYIGSPPRCLPTAEQCPADPGRQGLIGLFGEDRAREFYDSVGFGGRIEVVGSYDEGPVTTRDVGAPVRVEPRATTPPASSGGGVSAVPSATPSARPTESRVPASATSPEPSRTAS